MTAPLVSVIVLNWNGAPHLAPCLESVVSLTYRPLELVVVDNGSTDGSEAGLEAAYPGLKVLRLPVNRGYAGGNNAGIRATSGELVLLVNNDTVLDPDLLEPMVAALDDPRVASASSRTLYFDNPRIINAAGLALTRAGTPVSRGRDAPDQAPYDVPAEVFGAHGACVLYRRAALAEVGLFDDDFFAYHEEFDLAWRLRLAGWTARYVPLARVLHHEGLSLRSQPARILYLTERNRLWALIKNAGPAFLWRALPALLAREVQMLRHCLGMRTPVPLVARLSALARLGPMLARRARVQALRRVSDAEIERWLV